MIFFIVFVCILAVLFLAINFLFAPHNPYQEKYSIFECGFHSFLGQNRQQFFITFFVYGLLYLILDLEITIIFPYSVSQYVNSAYGLVIVLIFSILLCLGLFFEIGKNALNISSKQNIEMSNILEKIFSKFIIESIYSSNSRVSQNLKSVIFDIQKLSDLYWRYGFKSAIVVIKYLPYVLILITYTLLILRFIDEVSTPILLDGGDSDSESADAGKVVVVEGSKSSKSENSSSPSPANKDKPAELSGKGKLAEQGESSSNKGKLPEETATFEKLFVQKGESAQSQSKLPEENPASKDDLSLDWDSDDSLTRELQSYKEERDYHKKYLDSLKAEGAKDGDKDFDFKKAEYEEAKRSYENYKKAMHEGARYSESDSEKKDEKSSSSDQSKSKGKNVTKPYDTDDHSDIYD